MAKMFYTLDETKSALGKSEEEIKQYARDGRLREFRDGPRLMFKADQVEQLKAEISGGGAVVDIGTSDSGGLIGLVETSGTSGTSITLSDHVGQSSGGMGTKEDTALAADLGLSGSMGGVPSPSRVWDSAVEASGDTGLSGTAGGSRAGITVFGDASEIVDPSAQTAITGGIREQINLDGVGAGSGLLDLIRESDDTSLGAVLDGIGPAVTGGRGMPIDTMDTYCMDDEPVVVHVAPERGVLYPVWFGTNRRPTFWGSGFTSERHNKITRGRVNVYVPHAHRFGETGTSFWRRLLRFDLRDDHLRIQKINRLKNTVFFAEIIQTMEAAKQAGENPQALVFLHGFNVSFEDAAIRAAQIGCDLKVPGATAFFSWPSRGNVTAYAADEAGIEASEGAITDFLVEFAANCGAEKVHIIAHSMGNRGLLRALQRIAGNAQTRGKTKFAQVFLAAPDIDRDLFLELAWLYPQHAERTTLYASRRDLAVHLSAKLHNAPRAGYYEPYTVAEGLDTVAVPDFDVDLLGHSYFAQAEALLHDIHDLMRHGDPPAKRQRIDPDEQGGEKFWRLKR